MTYQFKIQLKGFKNPEVWRQVEVSSNDSFFQFHQIIATVFGERLNTMYAFSPSGKGSKPQIMTLAGLFDDGMGAKTTRLSTIFKYQGQTYTYLPDFDEWQHHIVLEKITNTEISQPNCLAGEGAYPPETCADIDDYEGMKQALSDKNHPQHKSIREWLELDENETWEDKYKFYLSKANEQLLNIDAEIKSFRNYTIVKHDTFDEQYGLNPSLWKIIDKKKAEILSQNNRRKTFRELERLVREYPDIPHFRNMLATSYLLNGENNRFYETMQQIIANYPDYVMSRCNLANQYTDNDRLDEVPEMLGKNLDLSELFPSRNGRFMEVEIFNYHLAAFRYLLKIKNDDDAQKHLDFLEYLFPDEVANSLWRIQLNRLRMEKSVEDPITRTSVNVIPEHIEPTDKAPDFENTEIKILYEQGAYIKREILYRIMELPRESVIKDLEKILIDSIARFDYFREEADVIPDAPVHALLILSALQAEEALDTLFTVLRQDSDYYDFWYGDIITEDFWRYIYMMGQNRIDRLKDFVLEPNRYTYARSAVASAVMQIAFQQKERKEEVIKWYEDVLQYMLEHRNDTNVFESEVYSYWFDNLLDVAEREHLPTVLRLYDGNLCQKEDQLPLHYIKKELVKPTLNYKIKNIFTSIDPYYDEWQRWFNNNDESDSNYNDKSDFSTPHNPATPYTAMPKIGRNDPCPCNSGKKYKKCCGANG